MSSFSIIRKAGFLFYIYFSFLLPVDCCDVNSNHTMQKMISKQIEVSFIPDSYIKNTTDIDYYRVNPGLIRYNLIAYRKNTVFSEIDEYRYNSVYFFKAIPAFNIRNILSATSAYSSSACSMANSRERGPFAVGIILSTPKS